MFLCSCNSLESRVVDHVFCNCISLRRLHSATGKIYTLIQNKSTYVRVLCDKIWNVLMIIQAKTNMPATQEIKFWLP